MACLLPISVGCQNRASDERTRQLFETAMSGEDDPDSVHKLAASLGKDKLHLLAVLASSDRASFTNRETAVSEIAKIGTEQAGEALAHLLVPHNSVILRQEAIRSLQSLPCSERCVESLLFYLCRRFFEGPSLRETGAQVLSLREQNAHDEQELISSLDSILLQNRGETISVLYLSYGIGSAEPSPFAIDVVEKLQLPEGCDLLLRTERSQSQLKKYGVADPTMTTKAIDRLGCRRKEE
jgi:hypothetical protein